MLFAAVPVGSSSGKLFVDDMTPRTVDEFLVGTARQINAALVGARSTAATARAATSGKTPTTTRAIAFNPPPGHPARALHPGSGGAAGARSAAARRYVIAELDGAYHEVLRGDGRDPSGAAARRSCAARTPGATTTATSTRTTRPTANDANIFIGSSNIGDGAGRQLWNFKDGDLRGDRPHMFKLYGYYTLPWNATAGAFVIAQSGQP